MKYVLISLILFSLMLAFCAWSVAAVQNAAEPVLSLLTAAKRSMENGSAENAAKFAALANERWQKNEVLFGILLHHEETDEVMRHFAVLTQPHAASSPDGFLSVAAELRTQLDHIRQMQLPSLQNIL